VRCLNDGADQQACEAEDDDRRAEQGGVSESPADDQRGGDNAAERPGEHDGCNNAGRRTDSTTAAALHVKGNIGVQAKKPRAQQKTA